MRGFGAGEYAAIEGRDRGFDRAAVSALLFVFLTADRARAAEALRGIVSSPSSAPDMAGTEFSVPAIAVVLAVLLALIVVVLHVAARHRWSRRTSRLEVELTDARAKLDRATLIYAGRAANRHLLGPSRCRADPRRRPCLRRGRGGCAASLIMPPGSGTQPPLRCWTRRSASSAVAKLSRYRLSAGAGDTLK